MEKDEVFYVANFGPKIGLDVQTIKARRSRNLIFGSAPVEPNSFIFSRGRGPGSGLVATRQGAAQLAVAEPLIRLGLTAKRAYTIAAEFSIAPKPVAYWVGGDEPELRGPSQLFANGRTWLVCAVNKEGSHHIGSHLYFSDADRELFNGVTNASEALSKINLAVGRSVDGAPRILLNVSDVCFNLAKALEVNPFTAFGRKAN